MVEHDWEKLFIMRDDPGTGMPHSVYACLDRCSKCRALRSTVSQPYWYIMPQWSNTVEPECKEVGR